MLEKIAGLAGQISTSASRLAEVCPQVTFKDKIIQEKKQLEERLKNINAVLDALENAPEVLNVMEALNKLGY